MTEENPSRSVRFARPLAVGLAFGAFLGIANLIDTAVEPLADDTAPRMLTLASMVLVTWAVIAFLAARRAGNFRQAVVAGMLVGAGTLFMFGLANAIRINVFLDTIQYRDDWRNLMARYRESGDTSLRAFVNRDHLTPMLGVIGIGAAAGAVCGMIGGALSAAIGRTRRVVFRP
jgi:hypothetical protein